MKIYAYVRASLKIKLDRILKSPDLVLTFVCLYVCSIGNEVYCNMKIS